MPRCPADPELVSERKPAVFQNLPSNFNEIPGVFVMSKAYTTHCKELLRIDLIGSALWANPPLPDRPAAQPIG
jgi:hypothetical protein